MLRNSVLQNCSDLTDQIEIMAKICANVDGLAKAMQRDGFIEEPDNFKDFTLGFTQGKASFDFVDVGYGKERADSKIKGMVLLHGYVESAYAERTDNTRILAMAFKKP